MKVNQIANVMPKMAVNKSQNNKNSVAVQANSQNPNFGMTVIMPIVQDSHFTKLISQISGDVDNAKNILMKNLTNWFKPYLQYYEDKIVELKNFDVNKENNKIIFYIADGDVEYNMQRAEVRIDHEMDDIDLDEEESVRGSVLMHEKLLNVFFPVKIDSLPKDEFQQYRANFIDYLSENEDNLPPETIKMLKKKFDIK